MGSVNGQNIYLEIKGKDSLETAVIDSLYYNKKFVDFNSLKKEIEDLNLKIQKSGFIENELVSNDQKNDSTYFVKFSLNKKYYTIYIYYDNKALSKEFLEKVSDSITSEYFITTVSKSEDVLNFLNSKITENGQPFASLKLTNIKKKDESNIRADLMVSTDIERKIDKIIIKGYEDFPKSFIKRYLKIKPNTVFNLAKIKEKTEALNSLPFARQTKTPEILFTADSTALYLYLEKTKSNAFDGFLGFGTNETTNKIEFDGYLNLSLVNNLNYGESFSLIYKSEENEQKYFEANINLPYLFKSALGTELELNIFKKDSSYTTVNQSASLYYQINPNQKVFLGVDGVQSNNLLDNNSSPTIQDYNSKIYNLRYQFTKRQHSSLLFPINFKFDLKFGLGKKDFEGKSENQSIFKLNSFKIFNLNNTNSIYLKIAGAGINTDHYLTNELFRFGGILTIRGFEENSLLASLYTVLNTEYRYQLNNTIYIHSIFDAAYFENDIALAKEKLFGFGFGFGIYTKSGLLKFNYANGKSENQKIKLSDSKIHLSLSAIF